MRGTVAKRLRKWAKKNAGDLKSWGTVYMDMAGRTLRVSPDKKKYKMLKELWRQSSHETKAKAKTMLV